MTGPPRQNYHLFFFLVSSIFFPAVPFFSVVSSIFSLFVPFLSLVSSFFPCGLVSHPSYVSFFSRQTHFSSFRAIFRPFRLHFSSMCLFFVSLRHFFIGLSIQIFHQVAIWTREGLADRRRRKIAIICNKKGPKINNVVMLLYIESLHETSIGIANTDNWITKVCNVITNSRNPDKRRNGMLAIREVTNQKLRIGRPARLLLSVCRVHY
jgi:hypothetical protein